MSLDDHSGSSSLFEQKIRALERKLRSVEIGVLIWGPGSGGGEHYAKRCKLRDRLRACFPLADVKFSEELSNEGLPAGSAYLEEHQKELWHLAACDICIVLDTSKGAGEEIAHFSTSVLANRLCILTHETYKDASTFPAALRKYQNQHFYTETEYAACTVIERALAHVKQVALHKLLLPPGL